MDLIVLARLSESGLDDPAVGVVLVAEQEAVADGPEESEEPDGDDDEGFAAGVPKQPARSIRIGHGPLLPPASGACQRPGTGSGALTRPARPVISRGGTAARGGSKPPASIATATSA